MARVEVSAGRRDEAERSRASDERPSDETEAPERAVDRAAVERPRESQTQKRPVRLPVERLHVRKSPAVLLVHQKKPAPGEGKRLEYVAASSCETVPFFIHIQYNG